MIISVFIFVAIDVFWTEYQRTVGTRRRTPRESRPGLQMLRFTVSCGPSVASPHHLGRWVDLCASVMVTSLGSRAPETHLRAVCRPPQVSLKCHASVSSFVKGGC